MRSISCRYQVQSAFLRLMQVLCRAGDEVEVVCNPIRMGRWSELMVVCVYHSDEVMREADADLLLLVSLHHTFVIHCFTHLCAVSLYISRSSVVHACGRSGKFSKCSIVCGSSVQSHVVSSSQYPQLFILYLHLPTLVLSLLRHCHSHHGNEDPVANDMMV